MRFAIIQLALSFPQASNAIGNDHQSQRTSQSKKQVVCRLISIGVAEMDAISCTEKADELYQDDKFDEAIPFYDKALEQDPVNAELYNRRGLAFCHLDKYQDAIDSFDTALKRPAVHRCPEQ